MASPDTPGDLTAAVSVSHFVIHNPPDFDAKNAFVLGVCPLSEEMAGKDRYSWLLKDFVAWKSILTGKKEQRWMACLDVKAHLEAGETKFPDEVFEGIEQSLPADGQKCCKSLLGAFQQPFKQEERDYTGLVILYFGPVTPDQDLCIDFGGAAHGGGGQGLLTIDMIRTVVGPVAKPDTRITVVMPSAVSAGWACFPDLLGNYISDVAQQHSLISKSCGAAFAKILVDDFSTRSSPLLKEEQRVQLPYRDLMPIHKSDLQVRFLHKFQRKVHSTLEHHLSPLGTKHSFDFSPDDDQWASACGPRRGRSLKFWEQQWEKHGPKQPEGLAFGSIEPFHEAFGGDMSSQVSHVKYLVGVELATCPGDWEQSNKTGITRTWFADFLRGESPTEDSVQRVFDLIEYRASSMYLAQVLAKYLGLSYSVGCRHWVDDISDDVFERFSKAFSRIRDVFCLLQTPPGEVEHDFKNVRFYRPIRWLSVALATQSQQAQDVRTKAEQAQSLVKQIRAKQATLLMRSPSVVFLGFQWLESLNLGLVFGGSQKKHDEAQGQQEGEEHSSSSRSKPSTGKPSMPVADAVVSTHAKPKGEDDILTKAAASIETTTEKFTMTPADNVNGLARDFKNLSVKDLPAPSKDNRRIETASPSQPKQALAQLPIQSPVGSTPAPLAPQQKIAKPKEPEPEKKVHLSERDQAKMKGFWDQFLTGFSPASKPSSPSPSLLPTKPSLNPMPFSPKPALPAATKPSPSFDENVPLTRPDSRMSATTSPVPGSGTTSCTMDISPKNSTPRQVGEKHGSPPRPTVQLPPTDSLTTTSINQGSLTAHDAFWKEFEQRKQGR